jgi:hypothetical protein
MEPIVVYLASPYSQGDPAENVREHILAADTLMRLGYAFHAPLLSHFIHQQHPHAYEEWMALDMVMLARCDILLRLPGESPGADREVAEALRIGIPVAYSFAELMKTEIWGGNPWG